MSARELPRFPEDDSKLRDLKNWPKKRRIGGWDCELRIKRNKVTSAHYLCHPRWWPWGKREMRGPYYAWASDGGLFERAYRRSPKDMVIYQVDRDGRLFQYIDTKSGTTEFFDADGILIAGEYRPVNLDWRSEGYRGGTVSVWLGERVTHEDFVRRRMKLLDDRGKRF